MHCNGEAGSARNGGPAGLRCAVVCCGKLLWLLTASWLAYTSAHAQVIELNGGASTLYQAQGASIALRTPTSSATLGAGFAAGHFVAGGSLQQRTGPYLLAVGMQDLLLDLPTDVETGHHLRTLGIGIERGTPYPGLLHGAVIPGQRSPDSFQLFAGGTSSWMNTPLFQGIRPNSPAFAALLHHALGDSVQFSSQTVYAARFTTLESVTWQQSKSLRVAGTAGLSGGSPYGAGLAEFHRPLFDLKTGYVAAPETFQRAGLDTDLIAEPIRANVDAAVRSSRNPRYTAELAHHAFLNPPVAGTGAAISTVDDVSGSAHFSSLGLGASLIRSSYNGEQTTGVAVNGSVPLPSRWGLEARYMESRLHNPGPAEHERTGVIALSREVSSRLNLSGVFTRSDGRNTLAAEGNLTTNSLRLSADVQTLYIPTAPAHPFQQYLVFNAELNLFGRLRLLAGSFVSPGGKLLYTAEAHATGTRALPLARPNAGQTSLAPYILRGRVLDVNRVPIGGAAVDVDGEVLFTDSEGAFFLRERRKKFHRTHAEPEQFLDGNRYIIVSEPAVLESTRDIIAGTHDTLREPEHVAEFIVAQQGRDSAAVPTMIAPRRGGGAL